jgi:HlyD family secretion protein
LYSKYFMFKTTASRWIAAIVAIVIISCLFWLVNGSKNKIDSLVKVPVKSGRFDIMVTVTGELQALNSEDIKGPAGLRTAGIWQVKISDLIPEGSLVKEGDYIATLDRSELSNKLKDLSTELSKIESQYTQTRLDTALEMRKLRDDMVNLKFSVEEKQLILKQSKYEPPAAIRQAEIEVEKTKRTFDQEEKNYKLKLQQNKAKMQEVAATLSQQQTKYDRMTDLLKEFVVNAPKGGMLIYKKDWNGRKKKVGSTIDAWDATVATLPDLSTMISQTYVNEVDISKVQKGQVVKIGIDAFPDKKISGKVMSVANVGEQLPDNDAKVFEVTILLDNIDTTLRPAMTTSNTIMTQTLKMLYIFRLIA